MKFKVFHGGKPTFDKSDFDTKDYECVNTYYTKKDQPVTLSRHKTMDVWKVQYYYSTFIFKSYTEAVNFCEYRFYDKNGNKLNKRKGV